MKYCLFILSIFFLYSCTPQSTQSETNNPGNNGERVTFYLQKKSIQKINEEIYHLYRRIQDITKYKESHNRLHGSALELKYAMQNPLLRMKSLQVELANATGGIFRNKRAVSKKEKEIYEQIKFHEDPFYDGFPIEAATTNGVQDVLGNQQANQIMIALKNQFLLFFSQLRKINDSEDHMYGVKFTDIESKWIQQDIYISDYDPEINYFEGLTAGEAMLLLQQMEIEMLQAYRHMLNVIALQLGNRALVFDFFDIFSEQGKPSYKKGEAIKFNVGLGTYSSMSDFSIFVDDQELAIDKYGKAVYKTTANTLGKNNYEVKVSVRNPLTGMQETFTKTYSYTVTN